MTRKWIVLIGPPAVGKTTLSNQLKSNFNANCYSFDKEFPLEIIKFSIFDSKNHRKHFLEKIKADESEWIIIDDTCHLKSMQKRYVQASEESDIKVVFLYLSVRNEEVNELKERNIRRGSDVKDEEIEKITKYLNSNEMGWNNFIEYNFKQLPSIETIVNDIKIAFDDYKWRNLEQVRVKDLESDYNFFNRLNLALNKEISDAFRMRNLDGKEISLAKKKFIEAVRNDYDYDNDDDCIIELVLEFRNKYLYLNL